MTQAQGLARELNALAGSSQFSNSKARAAARGHADVDWPRTKAYNGDFNAEVDGCESFVMRDGSRCEWVSGTYRYVARPAG